jgi:hypothetical protein
MKDGLITLCKLSRILWQPNLALRSWSFRNYEVSLGILFGDGRRALVGTSSFGSEHSDLSFASGRHPRAALIEGSDEALYGTTYKGGSNGAGMMG